MPTARTHDGDHEEDDDLHRYEPPGSTVAADIAVRQADRQAGPGRRIGGVAQDPGIGTAADDRVAALQGRLRPEGRRAPRRPGPVEPHGHRPGHRRRRAPGDPPGRGERLAAPGRRSRSRWPGRGAVPARSWAVASWAAGWSWMSARRSWRSICSSVPIRRATTVSARRASRLDVLGDVGAIGDDELGRGGRRGRAHVGGEVGQRHVRLVTDRRPRPGGHARRSPGRRPPR